MFLIYKNGSLLVWISFFFGILSFELMIKFITFYVGVSRIVGLKIDVTCKASFSMVNKLYSNVSSKPHKVFL